MDRPLRLERRVALELMFGPDEVDGALAHGDDFALPVRVRFVRGTDQERVLARAKALLRLAPDGIVPVLDLGTIEDASYVAYRRVAAPTLAEQRDVDPKVARAWLVAIAGVLDRASSLPGGLAIHGAIDATKILVGERVLVSGWAEAPGGDPRFDRAALAKLVEQLMPSHAASAARVMKDAGPIAQRLDDALAAQIARTPRAFDAALGAALGGEREVAPTRPAPIVPSPTRAVEVVPLVEPPIVVSQRPAFVRGTLFGASGVALIVVASRIFASPSPSIEAKPVVVEKIVERPTTPREAPSDLRAPEQHPRPHAHQLVAPLPVVEPTPTSPVLEPEAAPIEDAELSVRSDKPARVYLDGRFVGVTPLAPFPLSPGRHRVKLTATESGATSEQEAVLVTGRVVPLTFVLK